MKVVIIGGVAAGTKVAAKLKREHPQDEIVIYTKGNDISYAGCGLPYYMGGFIETEGELIVNTPEKFMGLTGSVVHTNSEVVEINPEEKTILVQTDKIEKVSYDKLVIATGANSLIPPVEGVNLPGVFSVRTPKDAIDARKFAEEQNVKHAVVVGGGFIGLEVAENLMARGIAVTVVDMAAQLMPNIFDADMADYIRRKLQAKGMRILTGTTLVKITGTNQVDGVQTSVEKLPAKMVILAAGIRQIGRAHV